MKNDGNLNHIRLPNISPEIFQVILRYIYGGIFSLDEQEDTSNISKILAAADQLHLQELVDHLQKYLIENEFEWIEQHFELIHRMSFQSNSLLELQQFCTGFIAKFPEKIFKSLDFTSISEKSLISIIKRDDLQMDEVVIWDYVLKWGLAQNSIGSDPTTWSDNEFNMMKITLRNCLPFIKFFGLSSKDFFRKVRPYKKLLNDQLYEELLEFHLDTESEIPNNILFPRSNEIGSKIININIVSLISAWIDNLNIKNKYSHIRDLYLPYTFKLLLRGSRDGFTPKNFHTLCNNIPHTITFIKVKGSEEIIGGYNPLMWKNSCDGEWGKTKDSFLFSFKNKNNFKGTILSRVKDLDRALFYCNEFGPAFDTDLLIYVNGDDCSKEYNSSGCKQRSYEKRIRDSVKFSIDDYEVFQIIKKKS
ncbi:hypothetical protein GLOIN_2v1481345 [Rhizophagus clarus]|nr:hypothetical protein GLOIN_2v1481345 [Rhizophagus clarus]